MKLLKRNKLAKRLLCLLLSAFMIMSVLPVGMVADGEVTYPLASDGVMTTIPLTSDNIGSFSADGTYGNDGSVTYSDITTVSYKLPDTYATGTTLYVHITGTNNGSTTERAYLITGSDVNADTSSTVIYMSSGEFDLWTQFTVGENASTAGRTISASEILFKGYTYGEKISNLTIASLEIYEGTANEYYCAVNGHTYVDGVCTNCGDEEDHCTDLLTAGNITVDSGSVTVSDGSFSPDSSTTWIAVKLDKSYAVDEQVTIHISGSTGATIRWYLSAANSGQGNITTPTEIYSGSGDFDITYTFTVQSGTGFTGSEALYLFIKPPSGTSYYTDLTITHLGIVQYGVNVADSVNGTVTTNRERAGENETVTLTVTPDDLYELDTLTVTDRSGNVVTTTAGEDDTYTFTMPASNVTVSATFVSDGTKVITPVTISTETTSVLKLANGNGEYTVADGTISVSNDTAPSGVYVRLGQTFTTGETVTLKITGTAYGDFRMYLTPYFNDNGMSDNNTPIFASAICSDIASASSSNPVDFSFTVSFVVTGESANTLMIKGTAYDTAMNTLNITSISIISSTPSFYGRALTLDGEIGVTYYFSMDGVTNPEAYYLVASINGTSVNTVTAETKTIGGVTYYRYTVYVSVADINSTIKAYLTDGTTTVEVSDYSVATYCTEAASVSDKESALCQALLTYGYYTGVLVEEETNITDYTDMSSLEVDIDSDTYGSTDTTGVAKTLALDSTISIRMYLTSEVASDATFTVNGTTLTVNETTDDYSSTYPYYIEFKVSARNLDTMYTVYKNGEEFTKYSVYSYIMNNYQDTETTGLADLCKAIYNYSLKAEDYDGWV